MITLGKKSWLNGQDIVPWKCCWGSDLQICLRHWAVNQGLGDLVSCRKWGRRHWNLNCLSSLTLCRGREEREGDTHSLGSRNGEWHFSWLRGKGVLWGVWFWGKYLHFPVAVCPHSRNDIVPVQSPSPRLNSKHEALLSWEYNKPFHLRV